MATQKVLVVDDNLTTLAMVSFLLSHKGSYEVLATPSPKQALEIIKSNPFIDVVVSDVEMPELRGPDLINAIKQTSPATGCVLMSASLKRSEDLPPDVPLLPKPINATELFSAVRRVLSESRQAGLDLGKSMERAVELQNQAISLKRNLDGLKEAVATTLEESQSFRE